MEADKNIKNNQTKDKKKSKFHIRTIVVLAVLVFFIISSAISLRAEYLHIVGIGSDYENVFYQKIQNKYTVFGVAFLLIYIFIYIINKFNKKGLKKFFDEEKKEMPKLPNKSLSIVLALIGGIVAASMLADKFAIFNNAAQFVTTDQIFGADIGYYMFSLPFIQSLLIFIIEALVVTIVYVAIYYVVTLNIYFDGVDGETLKKNTFVKQEIFVVVLITVVFSIYVFISSQNILTGSMVTIGDENYSVELVGAGKSDVTVKLWGYRILSFVIVIAVLRLLKYVKKQNFKQSIISVAIVPAYLMCLFIVMIYFQTFHVGNSEMDNEKEYIGYNIKNTKTSYGIDIDQQNIDNYKSITSEEVTKNQEVIDNIPVITESVTEKAVTEHQENSVYYNYENSFLAVYTINKENKLVYITPREILTDSSVSYNNRTLRYTHGYSLVVSSATDSDNDGYAEYLLSDFTSEENLNIKEPRIYFGLKTDSTIKVNTSFGKEYDYPITPSTYNENVYDGKAGLKLGFLDRLVLGISEKDFKLALSRDITNDTKIISKRNIIERAKTVFPDVLYDEDPYLVINSEGKLVWVLDAYTRSASYPYAQTTTINIKGYKERINYIRNSVKVLIDAYDGTTTFYITDESDPIIMTYKKIYPDLFTEKDFPVDIASHVIYPEFLYKIQAGMISLYHDISEDTLYRADDIWQTTKIPSATANVAGADMEPYYTMLKTVDNEKAELGLVLTYNKYGKQNIISYLVGTVENGKPKLSLYKFSSESNVVGIIQLNNQIEQDATIAEELKALNTTGTKLIKEMIIVPINKSLLYVEPVYQVMVNGDSEIPILKKVIVASGNTVAIGDSLESAIANLFNDDYAVDLDIVNTDDLEAIVDSVIKANNNLKESLNSNDFEMIGKDITRLQNIVNQLETARNAELEKQKEQEQENSKDEENSNTVDSNTTIENTSNTENTVNTSNVNMINNAVNR